MKKIILLATVVIGLSACDTNGITDRRADSLAKNLDTTFEKLADSARQKGGRFLDTLERKIKNLRDSARKE